jgi:phosphatidylglycerophosphatase A
MKIENTPSLRHPEVLFMSLFGIGFARYAPGTFGTLATMPFLYVLSYFQAPFFIFIPFLLIATVISCFIADYAQKKFDQHDPSWIVIDESLGIFTAWLFMGSHTQWWQFILIFVLFRFFDIIKFYPATYFDEKVHHGSGTILDDIISGLYAGLIFLLINYFISS